LNTQSANVMNRPTIGAAAALFLISAILPLIAAASQQSSSGLARAAAEREASLVRKIAETPTDPAAYYALENFQEEFGAFAAAEATLLKARQALPTNKDIALELHSFYQRRHQFQKALAALRAVETLDPADLSIQLNIANVYLEKAKEDTTARRAAYVREGIAEIDRVLAVAPDHQGAIGIKVLLLWQRAELTSDPQVKSRITAEASALLGRGLELMRKEEAARSRDDVEPRRPGKDLTPPTRIKDAAPVYPADAVASRTQGIVVIEATIGANGRVSDTKILRSVPLLDEAALDAVRQWIYEPTIVNGQAVPVIVTVTVNFTLQ
jgi:TonB family protein